MPDEVPDVTSFSRRERFEPFAYIPWSEYDGVEEAALARLNP